MGRPIIVGCILCLLGSSAVAQDLPKSESRRAAAASAETETAQSRPASPRRPMKVDDLFTLSELGDVALSPDGEWIAATVTRPGLTNGCPTCNYKAAGDVWLINRRTGDKRNLTNGVTDSSSSWLPVWSPSGRHLAFVSTKTEHGDPPGESNIRLHAWDSTAGTATRLDDRGVYLQVEFLTPGRPPAIAWVSDTTLLAALLPAGVAADEQILYWRRGVAEATRAWAKWTKGTEPTASILESGKAAAPLPTVSLLLIDVAARTGRTVAEIPKWDLWDLGVNMQVAVSPDSRSAAFLAVAGTIEMRADRPITGATRTYRAGVASLDQSTPVVWAATDGRREHVDGHLLGWSPDSRAFAISELAEPGTKSRKRTAFVVSATDGAVRDVTPGGMTVSSAVWTADGHVLARARSIDANPDPALSARPARWDWWRLDGTSVPVNVTASMPQAPSTLSSSHVANRFIGLADGAIWAIDGERDAPVRVTAAIPESASFVQLPASRAPDSNQADVLIEARVGDRTTLTHVVLRDLSSAIGATLTPIALPTATATLVEGDPRVKALIFSDETPEGVFLWTTDGQGARAAKVLALNEHVGQIAEGSRLMLSYRGVEGDALQGLAILPPSYEAGKRYPVATWVYGGLMLRDTRTGLASKNSTRPLNLEVLAGHGYVVLIPSIPLPSFGVKADPWIEIPKGVIACVDKLIDLGIADPDRLAVLGHSTGGYSTYAVVTYTSRFKAAVALSGHPDLISLYGQFYPGERMNSRVHEALTTVSFDEWGPMNMGGPPWDDFWHYMRNSPLFYLDRIRTPLMIVHGDMDGAPIQQGEEAFTGLYRLGKRAKFVRYWGEGHVVASPVNVRHLWAQIFDWLDTNLGTAGGR